MDPGDFLSGMNATLLGQTQQQFVTAPYGFLDANVGELRYAAAAHPAMLLLRNKQVTRLIENGLMLAAFSFATYEAISHPLMPGDRLQLYTDGILEAANSQEEEFGEERWPLC